MSSDEKSSKKPSSVNEDEIFKSLSHNIRREIVKIVGTEIELPFSQIKKRLEPIDSPTLSYHLKSLFPLLEQKNNKYKLSVIGDAAFRLLLKTDQSVRIKEGKKKFLYAYIITVICWISAETLIPLIYNSDLGEWKIIWIVIVINVISVVNFILVWRMKERF